MQYEIHRTRLYYRLKINLEFRDLMFVCEHDWPCMVTFIGKKFINTCIGFWTLYKMISSFNSLESFFYSQIILNI